MTLENTPPELETVSCNLCGARSTRDLYRAHDYRLHIDDQQWQVVECRECGLGYVNPRPTPRAMGRYYPADYYGGRERAALNERYAFLLARVEKLPRGKLLDIGCARGDWTQMAKQRGFDVTGLEVSLDGGNPHGLRLIQSSFPDAGVLEEGSFDVITSWTVFEHLHDPAAAFRRAGKLLRPGGTLVIMVPNLRSIASRYAYAEDLPRHLYMFNEETLRRYGGTGGLTLESVEHCPQFFGGSGRGALRVRVQGLAGMSTLDYFAFVRRPIRQRLAEAPGRAVVDLTVGLFEKVVFSNEVIRRLRLSGHVVATYRRAD